MAFSRRVRLGLALQRSGKTSDAPAVPTGDPHIANVKMLCGFNGANNATTFTDESASPHTLTAVDSAKLDTSQFKFGASSLLLVDSDWASSPDHADWDFGAGQFTVEGWWRWSQNFGSCVFVQHWPSWAFWMNGGVVGFRANTFADATGYAFSPTLNQWYHLAIDRDASGVLRIYIDGVMRSKDTGFSYNFNDVTATLDIGSATFGGWIDELRITKGVARYASDGGFTVPTAAFPRS